MSKSYLLFHDIKLPEYDLNITSDFGSSNPISVAIPGQDGEWSVDGRSPSRVGKGTITVEGKLVSDSREELYKQRALIYQLQSSGLGKLETRGPNPYFSENVYCQARLQNIDAIWDENAHSLLMQPMTLTFEVPNPVWIYDNLRPTGAADDNDPGFTPVHFDEDYDWDNAHLFWDAYYPLTAPATAWTRGRLTQEDNIRYERSGSQNKTTFTMGLPTRSQLSFFQYASVAAVPQFYFTDISLTRDTTGGRTARPFSFQMERLENGVAVEYVHYTHENNTVPTWVEIDGIHGRLTVNGHNVIGKQRVTFNHPEFFHMLPAHDNQYRFLFPNAQGTDLFRFTVHTKTILLFR